MEIDLDKKVNRLTVRLTDEECLAIVSGGIFRSITKSPSVTIRPLSEIDATSRPITNKDGPRKRSQLSELRTQATVNTAHEFTIFVPEALAQTPEINAEVLDWHDIEGDFDNVPHGGVRIEFGQQDTLS